MNIPWWLYVVVLLTAILMYLWGRNTGMGNRAVLDYKKAKRESLCRLARTTTDPSVIRRLLEIENFLTDRNDEHPNRFFLHPFHLTPDSSKVQNLKDRLEEVVKNIEDGGVSKLGDLRQVWVDWVSLEPWYHRVGDNNPHYDLFERLCRITTRYFEHCEKIKKDKEIQKVEDQLRQLKGRGD
jgi:hypothetical protein